MLQELKTYLKGWEDRIMNMVARGFVKAVTRTAPDYLQKLQVKLLNGETIEHEQMQEYGFCSYPLVGCQNAVVFVNGSRANGIVIATDDQRYRIALEAGEVALYTKFGATIKMDKDDKITITADEVEAEGDTTTTIKQGTGKVEITGGVVTVDGIAISGIKLGATAVLPIARQNDEVWTAINGTGTLLGYVNAGVSTVQRLKVLTE